MKEVDCMEKSYDKINGSAMAGTVMKIYYMNGNLSRIQCMCQYCSSWRVKGGEREYIRIDSFIR